MKDFFLVIDLTPGSGPGRGQGYRCDRWGTTTLLVRSSRSGLRLARDGVGSRAAAAAPAVFRHDVESARASHDARRFRADTRSPRALNPRASVTVTSLADNIGLSPKDSRFAETIAWAIGLLGLALAVVGVFGAFA